MTTHFTDYQIMMAILDIYARSDRQLALGNIVGKGYSQSDLERSLGCESFSVEERAQAMRCAAELMARGLVVPTYSDLVSPEEWRVITAEGRDALKRGALDELDAALWKLSHEFVSARRGALIALNSATPDAMRQAAHSARELVSQVLHVVSPDDEVRSQPWFVADKNKPTLITRKQRYKYAIMKRSRGMSETDLSIALKAGELLDVQHQKLSAGAHNPGPVVRADVEDAINTVEMVLRVLLL
ncbi:hypothetical protein [Pleomorphomonas carboxyditropha]|uniref:Predicted pPIWI-associating nuclease domain-containing protein n=1 Tax=Pleomorphomonas carboxyditropha TaxID=2023338 RepID=A0A2G9X124_9HYPH|nr:hypothetical protein [Pleomorphomonas carboxyditropha]PIP00662.1 hypothetical protein CJ014_00735 [Pleomorphomonas carboxyditropha]